MQQDRLQQTHCCTGGLEPVCRLMEAMMSLTDSCEYVIEKIKALLTEIPVKIFPQQQQIFTTSAMVFINNLNKAVRGKE